MALSDFARALERRVNTVGLRQVTTRGWRPDIVGYAGYGTPKRVHVLGRVLMAHPDHDRARRAWDQRGYRQFFTIQVSGLPVTVTAGGKTVTGETNDDGYVDVIVPDHGLAPGWHDVTIAAEGADSVTAQVMVVSPAAKLGIVSDIDDTVMITMLPRAVQAAWNSWVIRSNTRKPVPGMGAFYRRILDANPNTPVFYLSTGAWNTYDTLKNFMRTHALPWGPLLLTDWGPTPTSLFRNGMEHKKVQLRNLIIEYPDIQWILVGDDGQHDPLIFGDLIAAHPERISGVAVRNLSPQEHILSHGTAAPLAPAQAAPPIPIPFIQGTDGYALLRAHEANRLDRPGSREASPVDDEGTTE